MLPITSQFASAAQSVIILPPQFEEAEEKAVFENLHNLEAGIIGLPLVVYTLSDLDPIPGKVLFRYFAWPMPDTGRQPALEFAALPQDRDRVKAALEAAGMAAIPAPDLPGLASGRAIAMIVNEAAMLAEEGIAAEADIDTAMRLGTNYPVGPFAWMQLWGPARTRQLLQALHREDPERYVLARRFQ